MQNSPLPNSAEVSTADPMVAFEMMGDLDVIFDDGTVVKVHSAVLGLSSPVFAAMITIGMREAQTKCLELPGKSREEFDMFMSFLRPLSTMQVSAGNVDALLPWVCEYQVFSLKEKCEEVLLSLPCSVRRLIQAHTWNLQSQYQRCLTEVTYDEFQVGFDSLVGEKVILEALLPHLTEQQPSLQKLTPFLLDASSDEKMRAKSSWLLKVAIGAINALDIMTIVALSVLSQKGDSSSLAKLAEAHFEEAASKGKAAATAATESAQKLATDQKENAAKVKKFKEAVKVAATEVYDKVPASNGGAGVGKIDEWAKNRVLQLARIL